MANSALKLGTVVSQPFEENTYIAYLAKHKECLIFDPGFEPEAIFDFIDQLGLVPAAILCTHGHGDHIGGNEAMKQRWPDCPLVIGAGDEPLLSDPLLNLSAPFGIGVVSPPADRLLGDGERFLAAGFDLETREIPGHSPGHVVYVWHDSSPKYVFGGDVLFSGSIGRTDFPGGSFEQLRDGIRAKLFDLPDDTIVLPGHGPPTTIGEEKQSNPFVGLNATYEA